MSWWKRRGWEKRMDAELRFHMESRVRDYVAEGLGPDEAARRATEDSARSNWRKTSAATRNRPRGSMA